VVAAPAPAATPAPASNGDAASGEAGHKRRRRRGPRREDGAATMNASGPAPAKSSPAPVVPAAPVGVSKESFLRRLSARVRSWVGSPKP
jgi:hypothetical protein